MIILYMRSAKACVLEMMCPYSVRVWPLLTSDHQKHSDLELKMAICYLWDQSKVACLRFGVYEVFTCWHLNWPQLTMTTIKNNKVVVPIVIYQQLLSLQGCMCLPSFYILTPPDLDSPLIPTTNNGNVVLCMVYQCNLYMRWSTWACAYSIFLNWHLTSTKNPSCSFGWLAYPISDQSNLQSWHLVFLNPRLSRFDICWPELTFCLYQTHQTSCSQYVRDTYKIWDLHKVAFMIFCLQGVHLFTSADHS